MTDKTNSFTDKAAARSHFTELRRSIPENLRIRLNGALCSNAAALSQFSNAHTLLCYYPVRGEPDILLLAAHALELGKAVAFPISHTAERRLSFHAVNDLSQLKKGAYGIPEPSASLTEITDFSNSVCLVPALAFDRTGKRLGYGGGYYDRFLSNFCGFSMGLTYEAFYVDRLPTEQHDATVDIVITENGGCFSYAKRN